jgi:hypothetical protein
MQIHYLQPYAVDKNIGKAYNEACALIPSGDWICITDQDVMFLLPDTKAQINAIVQRDIRNGHPYHLYTCVTNRLGEGWQLHNNERSENPDVKHHMDIARMRKFHYGMDVVPYTKAVGGFFMLFNVNVWAATQFKENSIHFDTLFADSIRGKGGIVGLMLGVYVFHLYRFGQPNPEHKSEHLI